MWVRDEASSRLLACLHDPANGVMTMDDHPNQTMGTQTTLSGDNSLLAVGGAAEYRQVVLLADDEPAILSLYRRTLEKRGFRVLLAADGLKALEIFREHAGEIVGVLLDCSMPQMTGTETFDAIRNIRADVPIILTSGFPQEESAGDIHGRGPAGFLQKPFTSQALIETFQRSLPG